MALLDLTDACALAPGAAVAATPIRARSGPLISVITVVLDGAAHLEHCILSVANQTYAHIEFIVIDGGSTDGSLEIIKRHESAIDHWVSEPDTGIYDALNKGVQAATGDWLCVLGADDFLYADDVLEKMARSLVDCDPDVKLVYGNVAMFDGGRELCVVGRPWPESKPRMAQSTAVPYTALMHRRSWFDTYGLYDTSFRIAGDYEMLLRGWPHEDAMHVPGLVTAGMRIGGISNDSRTAFASLREVRRAQAMRSVHPPSALTGRLVTHTLVRYVVQKAWNEGAMWRLRGWRESLSAAG